MIAEPNKMVERLEAFIAERGRYKAVKVENLTRMSGGVSHEIWSFDAFLDGGSDGAPKKLVLRLDPSDVKISLHTGRRDEFLMMRAAHRDGVPLPEVFWLCEDTKTLGAPFFIMERVEGETISRRLLRDPAYARAREVIIVQLAEALARIHRVDPVKHGLDFMAPPVDSAARTEILRYLEIYHEFSVADPHPVFDLAARWMLSHLPARETRGFVHADFRIGNVVFGPEGLRAVLDFEGAHIGDPLEDVGWFMIRPWRYGEDEKDAGGLASRQTFLDAYANASGTAVDPKTVYFWEVYGNFRWGVVEMVDARVYNAWRQPNIELASVGRRTAETELELLNLIG